MGRVIPFMIPQLPGGIGYNSLVLYQDTS